MRDSTFHTTYSDLFRGDMIMRLTKHNKQIKKVSALRAPIIKGVMCA